MSIRTYDNKHKKRANLEVKTRIEALQEAVDAGRSWLDPELLTRCEQRLVAARHRVKLSLDHTVIVVAGTTGSGKSSLVNALAQHDVSPVSAHRPTTSVPRAVVWDATEEGRADAGDLLDWLGVREQHHFTGVDGQRRVVWPPWRPTPQTAEQGVGTVLGKRAFRRGLIVVDLPDVDSLAQEHRAIADPLMARADVVVWVTDPQKYADATFHRRLQALPHGTDIIVVLNHADRLTEDDAQACFADVQRVVRQTTSARVRVMMTSAVSGAGVRDVAAVLDLAASRRASMAATLNGQLRECGEEILSADPEGSGAEVSAAQVEELIDDLARALGVDRIADAVRRSALRHSHALTGWPLTSWVSTLRRDPLAAWGFVRHRDGERSMAGVGRGVSPVQRPLGVLDAGVRASISMAISDFVFDVSVGGPVRWREQVGAAVDGGYVGALDSAVSDGDVVSVQPASWWGVAVWVHRVFLLAMVVGLGWLSFLAVAAYLRLDVPNTPAWMGFPIPTIVTVAGVLGGVMFALLCRVLSMWYAQREARRVYRQLRSRVSGVVRVRVVEPVELWVDQRERCRVSALVAAR